MIVGDDNAFDGFSGHDARKMPLPEFVRGRDAIAGIDDGPAVTVFIGVFQQPQIDVVERERQRHANPVDTGRDEDGFTRRGWYFVRVVDHFSMSGLMPRACFAMRQ